MSMNKNKYFVISSYQTVRANNKTDALNVANGYSTTNASVLSIEQEVSRISAGEAHELSSSI